ncbi:MAG: haloacid dehalogenase type II [Deltaproteobacteria bacterium]|nr:MAG: haloacid dehalogenase type II [Deltaproteobacteria bacterium]
MLDFNKYEVFSFDCYGTLIDWEKGIIEALRPVLVLHNINLNDDEILMLYAQIEPKVEEGKFIKYKEVLRRVMQEFSKRLGFRLSPVQLDCLVNSLKNWKPFPDTVDALQALKKSFKLAIISNVDDDLFALSAKHLKVKFDWIITSEQTQSYKPSLTIFESAIKKIGVSPKKILHVAQSIFHDIVPAEKLGLSTVWVNRRQGKKGFGATPKARGHFDLEVPDLKTLVSVIGLDLK